MKKIKERERETETDRQAKRQRERMRERHTDRQIDGQTEREKKYINCFNSWYRLMGIKSRSIFSMENVS